MIDDEAHFLTLYKERIKFKIFFLGLGKRESLFMYWFNWRIVVFYTEEIRENSSHYIFIFSFVSIDRNTT